ncbi:MAG: succinate dehydrogenase assembly factor 2 [Sideroxydans sp.]|nr:succinate dehydrogenase assembly factor 2 [Sideroxydans sp.]
MSSADPVFLERMRWRCRRGMLEMDILLERFVEQRYVQLDEQQREAFDELLDLPDTDLWDMVRGDKEPEQARQREVLEWLKQV